MTTSNIVGYTLRCQDNNSYMFPDDMAASIRREARMRLMEYQSGTVSDLPMITEADRQRNKCPFCGYRLNFQPYNKDYQLKKKTTDIGATHDGQIIVSLKFKEFCLINKLEGITFREFDADKNCFQFIVSKEVVFDAKRRATRFEYLCPVCGNYESIVGADPTYLSIENPLARGIFRSDLVFASGNEKHPLTLVSSEIKAEMKEAGLKGLEFSPAYGTGK